MAQLETLSPALSKKPANKAEDTIKVALGKKASNDKKESQHAALATAMQLHKKADEVKAYLQQLQQKLRERSSPERRIADQASSQVVSSEAHDKQPQKKSTEKLAAELRSILDRVHAVLKEHHQTETKLKADLVSTFEEKETEAVESFTREYTDTPVLEYYNNHAPKLTPVPSDSDQETSEADVAQVVEQEINHTTQLIDLMMDSWCHHNHDRQQPEFSPREAARTALQPHLAPLLEFLLFAQETAQRIAENRQETFMRLGTLEQQAQQQTGPRIEVLNNPAIGKIEADLSDSFQQAYSEVGSSPAFSGR